MSETSPTPTAAPTAAPADSPATFPTALITGASRGIGRGIAAALGAEGFQVVVNYNANADAAAESAREVEQAGGKAITVQADVGNPEDHETLIKQTREAFGPVTLLVNNAGVGPKVRNDLLEMTEESYDRVMQTNLKGPFQLTQRIANQMLEQGDEKRGRTPIHPPFPPAIINIGSISAYTVSTNRGEYCLAKAAGAMMTKLFAVRLAEHGINVYEVRPGVIETDMTGPAKEKYDKLILEDERPITQIRRWGQPADIAKAVAALARGDLAYSTGEVINVDGGFHLKTL